MTQMSLALPGAVERDRAIDVVEDHASRIFRVTALETVEALARTRRELTTDDVWEALGALHPGVTTHEPRALGATMREASRRRWIVATDRVRASDRPVCHRRPARIWVSLLDQGSVLL